MASLPAGAKYSRLFGFLLNADSVLLHERVAIDVITQLPWKSKEGKPWILGLGLERGQWL